MSELTILDVPEVALEKILSFLSYDEIANKRLVCTQFNNICGGLLTKGFIRLEKKHAHIYKVVKSLLPKRPSERRSKAVVSRYCEILQGMETRIRMLNLTFMRHIEQYSICFLPGKVLDEISRLLRLIESRFDPPSNCNDLLEELRDLSSMAMEHFDEHISPFLEKNDEVNQYKKLIVLPSTSKIKETSQEDDRTQKELKKINRRNRYLKVQVSYLIGKTRRMVDKFNRQNIRVKKQSATIKDQNAKLKVQSTRLENHEITITELKKKFEELQTNFIDIKSKFDQDSINKMIVLGNKNETDMSKIRKIVQYENLRQKQPNVLRKLNKNVQQERMTINNNNRGINVENKKRRYRSMVDVDIWRHKCPTSRLTYSLWHKNYIKTKPKSTNDENLIIEPSTSRTTSLTAVDDNKSKKDFIYKSIIKQRSSKIFPLTRLDIERKRKTYLNQIDIPTKLSKNDNNNAMKRLDLIKKYLPGKIIENNEENLNLNPLKRKRDIEDDVE